MKCQGRTAHDFSAFIFTAVTMFIVTAFFICTTSFAADYWVLADEHDTPLPAPPPAGWYYNATGGDRGSLNDVDMSYAWDGESAYTVAVNHVSGSWTYGGMWYSLIRVDVDNIPLDFQNIFGLYIKPEYQGKITELEITVNNVVSPSTNANLCLKVELKDEAGMQAGASPWYFYNIISETYPKTFTIALNPPDIHNVKDILWVLDRAKLGDSITVDKVRLKASVPDISVVPAQEQAFYWTYSWLMRNYNSATGMVNDKSRDGEADMEAVTATAKAAKITYYAYKKGYVTLANTQAIITKIADTLINTVPRGPSGVNTIWPHFTKNGGTAPIAPHDGFEGTEWSSGDTLYAALDIIMALQMIGDPQNQIPSLENFLTEINWADLVSPEGHICHGYSYEGNKLAGYWTGFGMETIGVNWAYASATGNLADMEAPPSDNGSGFIDNAQYPMVLSGTDRWGNDWDTYRNNMANTQVGYYNGSNSYLYAAGLFGLSAAEVPDIASNPADKYLAYGTGGKGSPLDGDGEVVALHYSGMIADKKPAEAIAMWETLRDSNAAFLENRIIVSPLNNMESMKVDKETGALLAVNYLKGSWNLALQAEGWAMMDSSVRTDLNAAIQNNIFLKQGYELLTAPPSNVIHVPQDYPTIQQAIDAASSGDTIDVAAGTYNETLTLNKSGIILQGADQASVIQGVSGSAVINCSGISGSETKIKGFRITNGTYGIRCAGDVTSLTIENNYITYSDIIGIYLESGASAAIKNNSIYYCWRGIYGSGNNTVDIINNSITWNRGSYGGGIILYNAVTLIQNNYFFENWDGAINLYSNSNATIIGNRIYRNSSWDQAAGLNISTSTAILCNNLIQDVWVSHSPAVAAGLNATGSDISAFNNIFKGNSSARGAAINVSNTNFVCKNNIFTGNGSAQETVLFEGTGTQDFSYNDMFGNTTAADTTGITLGPGSITVDPLFVNTTDFYLGIGSPCVNVGDPDLQFNDLNFTRNDMGIYGGPYGDFLNSIMVNPGESIQTAIDTAASGTTVSVREGTYTGDIDMKDGVGLIGESAQNTIIEGNIVCMESDDTIENLTIIYDEGEFVSFTNPYYNGWYILTDAGITAIDSEITVRNCIIYPNLSGGTKSPFGKGIQIWNLYGSPAKAPLIDNSLIIHCDTGIYYYDQAFGGALTGTIGHSTLDANRYGIVFRTHKENPLITNNIISNSLDGIHITYEDGAVLTGRLTDIQNNCIFIQDPSGHLVWCDATQSSQTPTGTGNIYEDPDYTAPWDMDYFPNNTNCGDMGYRAP